VGARLALLAVCVAAIAMPRYRPRLALLGRIPGRRELVTWNCVIDVRRV
jgi:hypothetical protein